MLAGSRCIQQKQIRGGSSRRSWEADLYIFWHACSMYDPLSVRYRTVCVLFFNRQTFWSFICFVFAFFGPQGSPNAPWTKQNTPFVNGPPGAPRTRVQKFRICSQNMAWKFGLLCRKIANCTSLPRNYLVSVINQVFGVKHDLRLILSSVFFDFFARFVLRDTPWSAWNLLVPKQKLRKKNSFA